jgi:hypothetical protein
VREVHEGSAGGLPPLGFASRDRLFTMADRVQASSNSGLTETFQTPMLLSELGLSYTHRQFIRKVRDGLTYANAGSIGLPYEGRPGAFWMMVNEGRPELRETSYDLAAAVKELRAAGFAKFDAQLERSLLEPADPDEVSAFLERRRAT